MTSSRNARDFLYVVGVDEVGYGPNLGPFVVGASCWRVPAPSRVDCERVRAAKNSEQTTLFDLREPRDRDDDLFVDATVDRLNRALEPVAALKGDFPLVDSKRLYASKSLAALERVFFIAAAILDARPENFEDALRLVDDRALKRPEFAPPWDATHTLTLPADPKTRDPKRPMESAIENTRRIMAREKIELVNLRARRVHPSEFNRLLDRLGLKSEIDADATFGLVADALEDALRRRPIRDDENVFAVALCDKLGGRDRYADALARRFRGADVRVVKESRRLSAYRLDLKRFGDARRDLEIEFRFQAKGEANAPTALASVCAKYLREASMILFNDFWRRATDDPNLRPTAGYPGDARRFARDVENARNALGIRLDAFWRKK